jgi:hypothetical protein
LVGPGCFAIDSNSLPDTGTEQALARRVLSGHRRFPGTGPDSTVGPAAVHVPCVPARRGIANRHGLAEQSIRMLPNSTKQSSTKPLRFCQARYDLVLVRQRQKQAGQKISILIFLETSWSARYDLNRLPGTSLYLM